MVANPDHFRNQSTIFRGSYAKIHDDDRSHLISVFEDGRDWRDVVEVLGIRRQAALSIISKYRQTGESENRPRSGAHAKKMDKERIDTLIRCVEETRP